MRKLDLTRRCQKFLDSLPPRQFRQVISKIFDLLQDPFPPDSRPLSGFPYRRTNIGEHRIIYRLEDDTVRVALAGNRNDADVYRQLERQSQAPAR